MENNPFGISRYAGNAVVYSVGFVLGYQASSYKSLVILLISLAVFNFIAGFFYKWYKKGKINVAKL